jgi:hypothetical protein
VKLLRFMSEAEFDSFMAGKILENDMDWSGGVSKTGSKGFCFFPVGESYDAPERRLSYVSGIVSLDMAVIFETNRPLKKSYGMYRDPDEKLPESLFDILFTPPKMIRQDEYCTTSYSEQTMTIRKIGRPILTKRRGWGIDWYYEKN